MIILNSVYKFEEVSEIDIYLLFRSYNIETCMRLTCLLIYNRTVLLGQHINCAYVLTNEVLTPYSNEMCLNYQ